jgi:hypothetical protein
MATLNFKTEFPGGDQTYFIPKIWRGLINNLGMYDDYLSYVTMVLESGNEKMMEAVIPVKDINTIMPKIHTIREDLNDLWKPGKKIHMVVFNRTKNRFQFAPILECKSVQKIEISHKPIKIEDWILMPVVRINDLIIFPERVLELARNDGFDSVSDFFRWFNKDFRGKIIHWTDYKY